MSMIFRKARFSVLAFLFVLGCSFCASAQTTRLWSVTSEGGKHGSGTIFHINPNGSNPEFTNVHDFDGHAGFPFASLTYTDDFLFGLTLGSDKGRQNEGANGAIFAINTDGTNFRILHYFNGSNGSHPHGELIVHSGKLWGMTTDGGNANSGTLFTINVDGSGFKVIHHFSGIGGRNPRNSLLNYGGKFYGTTSRGGWEGVGVIFSINQDGTNYRVVHHFRRKPGGETESGLAVVADRFWGLTTRGGEHNQGSVFNIRQDGTEFQIVHDLVYPSLGDLIVHNGTLWGMTALRGEHNCGIIFNVDTQSQEPTYHDIHHLDCENGRFPEGNLYEYDGRFWGLTRFGGSTKMGVVFSIKNDGTDFKKHLDLNTESGGVPYSSFVAVPGNR